MTFANRLTELRKSRGISQKELANYIDVSPSLVGMYEQGRRKPSFEILEAIADYFNVNIDTLYGKDEFDFPYYEDTDVSEYAQAIKDNPNLRILFDASKDMSKADIDFVINTIEMLKKREGKKYVYPFAYYIVNSYHHCILYFG